MPRWRLVIESFGFDFEDCAAPMASGFRANACGLRSRRSGCVLDQSKVSAFSPHSGRDAVAGVYEAAVIKSSSTHRVSPPRW